MKGSQALRRHLFPEPAQSGAENLQTSRERIRKLTPQRSYGLFLARVFRHSSPFITVLG